MSGMHRVVVWEHQLRRPRVWLPYSPSVTQHLERAYSKNLTRVLLKDADPELEIYEVDLMKMCQTEQLMGTVTNVRRCLYPPNSPAAQGIRWEWYSDNRKQMWHRFPLDIQALIEQAWANGEPGLELQKFEYQVPFTIDFATMTQTSHFQQGRVQHPVRRQTQAPYPMLKVALPLESGPGHSACPGPSVGNGRANNGAGGTVGQQAGGAGSSTGGQNTGKLSQILHNIFGSKSNNQSNDGQQQRHQHQHQHQQQQHPQQPPPPQQSQPLHASTASAAQTSALAVLQHGTGSYQPSTSQRPSTSQSAQRNQDAFASVRSKQRIRTPEQSGTFHRAQFGSGVDTTGSHAGRRPSVDTVSTYLSHESQASSGRQHLDSWDGDILNSSMGSDEVFMPPAANEPPERRYAQMAATHPQEPPATSSPLCPVGNGTGALCVVNVTLESKAIAKFVHVADPPRWPRAQPCPMCLEELRPDSSKVNVVLTRCRHQMHLDCLNNLLLKQRRTDPWLKQYYIECPTCMSVYGVKYGNQPHGTMCCELVATVPGNTPTAVHKITFNFTSGLQGYQHPNPGKPFFAVGFPRHCFLPNTSLGMKMVYYLDVAFKRRLLFTIGRSVTTGSDDVVMWTHPEYMSQLTTMFPDPEIVDRCLQQLVHLGVTD
uniref:E3 ubiquitin-protein ligase n=1 Tax=Anopheles farauti TaxID=69004 RepID=A0A182Q4P1_9DIPT